MTLSGCWRRPPRSASHAPSRRMASGWIDNVSPFDMAVRSLVLGGRELARVSCSGHRCRMLVVSCAARPSRATFHGPGTPVIVCRVSRRRRRRRVAQRFPRDMEGPPCRGGLVEDFGTGATGTISVEAGGGIKPDRRVSTHNSGMDALCRPRHSLFRYVETTQRTPMIPRHLRSRCLR